MRLVALFLGIIVALPLFASALNFDANVQCAPGGKVGQPCKDNTNGYVTEGTCSYVYVCNAKQFPTNPPAGCSGSNCASSGTARPDGGATPVPEALTLPVSLDIETPTNYDTILSGFASTSVRDQTLQDTSPSAAPDAREMLLEMVVQHESEELQYAPESYDRSVSTLYAQLRATSVRLDSPEVLPNAGGSSVLRGGAFSETTFDIEQSNATPLHNRSTSLKDMVRIVFDSGRLLLGICAEFFSLIVAGLLMILTADFGRAATYFSEAYATYMLLKEILWSLISTLFYTLFDWLRSWFL